VETNAKLKQLNFNNEDYEWYPTTNEILNCIRLDMLKTFSVGKYRYDRGNVSYDDNSSYREEPDVLFLDSFIDVGAGDGRVFEYMTQKNARKIIKIKTKYGIEKARAQADDLIRRDIGLIGRDYFETVLIDKKFTGVFSNPPYSIYKEWCIKLIKEVNATFIYLVIPQRWKPDTSLKQLFDSKGKNEIIGSFDFSNGDREARSKADIIRIIPHPKNDTFQAWIEENIGLFEKNEGEEIPEEKISETNQNDEALKLRNENIIETLVENYKNDMEKLLKTFKTLGSIDFSIIAQLGVKKEDVINKIRADIKELKHTYWRQVFNHLDAVTSRLTHKMRNSILDSIRWFEGLDFNANNIYTIIVWVINNFNSYTKKQMLDVYDSLTNFEGVRAYKSNDKWLKDTWRYTKPVPVKYALDYRIVVNLGYQIFSGWSWNNGVKEGNPLQDLSIVARSLGFENDGIQFYDKRTKLCCYKRGGYDYTKSEGVLFEYRLYDNNNVHFKLDKEFLKVLNIEVGKLRGWLKSPADIQSEFDLSTEESIKRFNHNKLAMIGKSDLFLLTG
jgi:hypothetical protein